MARKFNEENERIKRHYTRFLREARRRDNTTVDKAAEAILRFERSTGYKSFKRFHIEQAVTFKRQLSTEKSAKTGDLLSKATVDATLRTVKAFVLWLAGQPGYKSRISYADAEYFNLNAKDARIAHTAREAPFPTMEQCHHAFNLMPGKPISAKDFIERMFGALPTLFKDEDELRKLWGNPDTRKALLEQLAAQGYDANVLREVRSAILADQSDIFDVLAHIAFAATLRTRQERAEYGRAAIDGKYDTKLAAFLNFVLGQYVKTGAEDLDRARLPEFLKLKFGSPIDGAVALGGVEQVAGSYIDFQRHLYARDLETTRWLCD